VIVICNDYPASNQNVIADLDIVRGGNVSPGRNLDIAPYDDSRREGLILITKNCLQPESRSSTEALSHLNGGNSLQSSSWTEPYSLDAKLVRLYAIVKLAEWVPRVTQHQRI
jgi:hypothetical protein